MIISSARFNAVMGNLHEVGYTGLDADEQAVCDAFDLGKLRISDTRREAPCGMSEPSSEEFVPRDYSDADGVQTMKDFA